MGGEKWVYGVKKQGSNRPVSHLQDKSTRKDNENEIPNISII